VTNFMRNAVIIVDLTFLSLVGLTDGKKLVTVDTWFTPAPKYSYGNATWYDLEVMEATAEWRHLSLEEYLDGVALMSPADIGKTVWLRRPNSHWEGPYLSVDCSMRGDMWTNIMLGQEVVEIGFNTAVRWQLVTEEGKILAWNIEDIEVYIGKNKPINIRKPLHYPTWWSENYKLATRWERHPIFIPPSSWNMLNGQILQHSDFTNPLFDSTTRRRQQRAK
jgi:hypothetical protein